MNIKLKGFTLIELMIVMAIVSLLMGLVGPLAINSFEKATAKQELLSVKNWLEKISYRSFSTGHKHVLTLSGKQAKLFILKNELEPISSKAFDALFFQPQEIEFSKNGFSNTEKIIGTYRNTPLVIELHNSVNRLEKIKPD